MSAAGSMRAVGFHRFGGVEALEVMELPSPVAQAGEVVVRVAAATINPTDLLMLNGEHAEQMKDLAPPYVAGMEFSGHIDQLGSGVTGLQPGQAVMGLVNPRRPARGAQAERVVVPAASVVPVPDGMDLFAAATIPMNGLTAWMCLDVLALKPGSVLLVTGAPGVVGGYVVQLAKKAGLRVLADGRDSDHELLRQLGADEILPRGAGLQEAVRSRYPDGVDALVDAGLVGDSAAALVRDGAAVALLRTTQRGGDPRLRYESIRVMTITENNQALAWLADQVRDGVLTPRVAANIPMEQARDAYAMVEKGGLRGKVVLRLYA